MPPLGVVMPLPGALLPSLPLLGALLPSLPLPEGFLMVSGVAGDAPEFRVRTVSIATCCDLYEFERTVRKLTCACASAQLLRPLRSWVSQFWRRGLDLLPSSAMLMTCRHLPGLMSMLAPPGPNRDVMPVAAGALWMALSWFPRVLFSSWVSMQS